MAGGISERYLAAKRALFDKAYASLNEKQREAHIRLATDGRVRYTVPQIITAIENTKVYFRVGGVYRNVKLVVKNGDVTVLEKKKQKVAPGEMETLTLTAKLLAECGDGATLTFGIEEA